MGFRIGFNLRQYQCFHEISLQKKDIFPMIKEIIFFSVPLSRQARNAICFVKTPRRDVFFNNSDGSPIKNVGDDKEEKNFAVLDNAACGCLLPILE
jgi:hypothetical protein